MTIARSRFPSEEPAFVNARALFGGMPTTSSTTATDEAMMNMIDNGGDHEDGQVEDLHSAMPKQEPYPNNEQPEDTEQTDASLKKKRGNMYTDKEDELLSLTWLPTTPFEWEE